MSSEHSVTRRRFTATASAGLALPVLAACGSDDAGTASTRPPTSGSGSGSSSGESSASVGTTLARTSDVEVGGAVFLDEPSVVVTQPERRRVQGIQPHLHASEVPGDGHRGRPDPRAPATAAVFDMTTGENVGGPAPSPLDEVAITVDGDSITLA